MNGIIVVNKQKGETSFRTVSAVRRIALEKKAGHCGTLDPLATGQRSQVFGIPNGSR